MLIFFKLKCLDDTGIGNVRSRLFIVRGIQGQVFKETLCKNILRKFPKTTAIMALTDIAAFHAYHTLRDMNVRIPEQISVTGYGNLNFHHSAVQMTTVDQHPYELGMRACDKLINIIEHSDSGSPLLRHPPRTHCALTDSIPIQFRSL